MRCPNIHDTYRMSTNVGLHDAPNMNVSRIQRPKVRQLYIICLTPSSNTPCTTHMSTPCYRTCIVMDNVCCTVNPVRLLLLACLTHSLAPSSICHSPLAALHASKLVTAQHIGYAESACAFAEDTCAFAKTMMG